MSAPNTAFAGPIPEMYDRHLGPLFFEPYAADLAARFTRDYGPKNHVLELACGTGRLTRHLLARLHPDDSLVATDLHEAMIATGRARLGDWPRLEWQTADAADLRFPDGSFDAVLSQFGFMFFPNAAAAEIARVLRPGGQLLFNVWGSLEQNPLGRIAHETIGSFFPVNPPTFYVAPFGFNDTGAIRTLLDGAGFSAITINEASHVAEAPSAEHAATGLVRGSPVLKEIQERGADPEPMVAAVAAELARAYPGSPLRVPMQALVVTARKSDTRT